LALSDFKIEGLGPVLAKLKALSQQVQKKAARSAATKAMAIVRKQAQAAAAQIDDPETASNISKAIVTRFDGKGSKREGGVVVKVGVMGGARPKKGTVDTGHWRFIEMGTSKIAAFPFMRPALANNVGRVTETFVSELDKSIDKIIAKGKV
jgi:HK97 gp10 family phage protein